MTQRRSDHSSPRRRRSRPAIAADTFQPLRDQTLAMQAADAIRGLIARGQLAGGDRLVESQIADQLQTSRGPVRDALFLLRAEGLVRDGARRGSFVVQLTAADVREIYDLRAAVETQAVRLLLRRRDQAAIAALEEALDQMRADAADPARAAEADLLFHGAVCEASGNSRLHAVFVRHATELSTLLRLDEEHLDHESASIVSDHQLLRDVLRDGDVARAERAFRTHLEEARDRVAEHFDQAGRAARRMAAELAP
jgi:GntR family transcriptional regulator, gluconate operon transcriptional repressor